MNHSPCGCKVGHNLAVRPPLPPKIKIKPSTCVALIVCNSLTQTCLECPGVSSRGIGQQWPAAGLGALSVAVPAWDLLKELTIIFITSISLASGQITGRKHSPALNRKLD